MARNKIFSLTEAVDEEENDESEKWGNTEMQRITHFCKVMVMHAVFNLWKCIKIQKAFNSFFLRYVKFFWSVGVTGKIAERYGYDGFVDMLVISCEIGNLILNSDIKQTNQALEVCLEKEASKPQSSYFSFGNPFGSFWLNAKCFGI